MTGEPSPLVLLSFLTALLALAVTFDAIHRRPARGLLPFVAMTLGTAAYMLFYALGLASVTVDEKILWTRFMYLSFMPLPAGLLAFAQRYTERKNWLKWYTPTLLAIEPVLTLILVWTNHRHHWVWTTAWLEPYQGGLFALTTAHGPWFWVHAVYSYGLILWALVILGDALTHSSRLFRRPLTILLASFSLPVIGYTLVIANLNPIAPMDPMPLAIAGALLLADWSLRGFRLFDLLPVARHALVERINEGMVVVNANGHIVDVNSAVLRLLAPGNVQVVGQPATMFLPFYADLLRRHPDAAQMDEEITWPTAGGRRTFDVHGSALHDRHGRFGGYLLVLHDITARKEAEDQARRRSRELGQLYDLSLELTTERDLRSLLQLVVQRASDLVHGTSGVIHLYRPEHDDLELSVAVAEREGMAGSLLKRGEGLAGRVLESGQPALVSDYRNWPGRSRQYDEASLGSVIAVPMRWKGGLVGVLAVGREAGRTYDTEEVRVLTLFASQAALVVARTQLLDAVQRELVERQRAELELQQRSRELARLYDTALEVSSQLDLPRLLHAITNRAVELLQGTTGDLSLYRPDSDDLEAAVLLGVPEELQGTVLKRGEGLSGRVLDSGAALVVDDYAHWPGRASVYDGLSFGPMVAVPLRWGERVLGTIDVGRTTGPPFTEAEVRLLSLFASQAAVAIANARLYADMQHELAERRLAEERLQRRTQELATLNDTVLEVASRLDLEQLLPIIVERAALLLRGTGCGMYLYQPTSDTLQHVVAYGVAEEFIGQVLRRGEGICGKVLESGEPIAVDDYHHWAGRSLDFESQRTGAMVAVPVLWGERLLGILHLQRQAGDSFAPEEIRLLALFANQAAIALANAQLYQAARHELAERKSTEARLQQAQRMEAVGVLAGGVAHEFNNLLTVIQGNVELSLADLQATHPARESLDTVLRATQRAAELTRQLLTFSRRRVLETRPVDLNAVISSSARMIRPALGDPVQLLLDLAPGLKPVPADAQAIEQVLTNLALNARDAMPAGGQLRIATAAVTLDEVFCSTRTNIKPGDYARMTVTDSGSGMDEDTLRQIFEPFFTTKEVGKGTGLGLAVVYGIVRQHGGLIEARSQVGQGTSFDVYLPYARE